MVWIFASVLLVAFAALALYDGVWLHLFKYGLYHHEESKMEHAVHTARAILFVPILLLFYLSEPGSTVFYLGLGVVLLDIFVVLIDARLEEDSRSFMDGLPNAEYILHLVVNGQHFAGAAVVIFIAMMKHQGVEFSQVFYAYHETYVWIVKNLVPGSVLVAVLHVLTLFRVPACYLAEQRARIACC